ncbi:hypothetical protein CDAR_273181 [Caerostris darwini]|uniref:Uncharacterized protein n=1 Tax=Caerostris darwini TaxID=1538125 RepID=A0AAV4MFR5_9ARAC|nr:hypothetical protein CDAR_273181 [Caerostris darwini]
MEGNTIPFITCQETAPTQKKATKVGLRKEVGTHVHFTLNGCVTTTMCFACRQIEANWSIMDTKAKVVLQDCNRVVNYGPQKPDPLARLRPTDIKPL